MSDIHICPKCGSTRKSSVSNVPPGAAFIGAISMGTYQCLDCDYEGIFPVIDESDLDNFRKEMKNSKK